MSKHIVRVKGSAGSGDWGHIGRPGKRGGSSGGRGTGAGRDRRLLKLAGLSEFISLDPVKDYKRIIELEAAYRTEHVTLHMNRMKELEVWGNSDPKRTDKWMHVSEAKRKGRYSEELLHGKGSLGGYVEVPMTVEENNAIASYHAGIEVSNIMFPKLKKGRDVAQLMKGKRMNSKYPGKSSITGESFEAGTPIFFSRQLGKSLVAPVSELEQK